MSAYVSRPTLVFPPYEITIDDIVTDIRDHHPDHPRLKSILRVVGRTGVERRRFTRPLEQVTATEGIEERNDRAFADLAELGEQAARGALAALDLRPKDVDCLITSHSTGIAVPGLDVHLINSMGLRPDVRRIPVTQLGCAGGAFTLVSAADHLKAHPGHRILVVVAEALSTVYQHSDTTIESMIYKALFGDAAGAVVVTDSPLGGGMVIDEAWMYTLPHTAERYRQRLDVTGHHFESTPAALLSISELVPPMLEWYGTAPLEFVIAHTGGPRILQDLEAGLGCDAKLLQHSWHSLRERGNLGGIAVLDSYSNHFDQPPSAGSTGLLVAMGPGFTAAACRGRWSLD
jgi:predicted naringenin-chalcone synthase